jgi:copper chaperone CopZ
MTGPATNAATIGTVWKIMGRRTALIYLATVAVSAVAAGLLLDYFFTSGSLPAPSTMPWMIPGYLKTAAGIVLLVVLGFAAFRRPKAETEGTEREGAVKMRVLIKGMSCHHCAKAVSRALSSLPGVDSVTVDHQKGMAVVTGEELDQDEIRRAVEEAGYQFDGVFEEQ